MYNLILYHIYNDKCFSQDVEANAAQGEEEEDKEDMEEEKGKGKFEAAVEVLDKKDKYHKKKVRCYKITFIGVGIQVDNAQYSLH